MDLYEYIEFQNDCPREGTSPTQNPCVNDNSIHDRQLWSI